MKIDLIAKSLLSTALALCQLGTQATWHAPVAAENGMRG